MQNERVFSTEYLILSVHENPSHSFEAEDAFTYMSIQKKVKLCVYKRLRMPNKASSNFEFQRCSLLCSFSKRPLVIPALIKCCVTSVLSG